MNFPTVVVLLIVAAAVVLALRSVIGNVKQGNLCGTCGNSCGGSCGHCTAICESRTGGEADAVMAEAEIQEVISSLRENENK